jgi:hypothetical protein
LMKKLLMVLLMVATGCATTRVPLSSSTGAPIVGTTPAPVSETTISAAKQVTSVSAPVSEPTASAEQQAPPEISSAEPGHPETTARKRRKMPKTDQEEGIVPDHKLNTLADLAAINDARLMHVFVGMYRVVVERYMGSSQHNPYRRTTITGSDGQVYEVCFYLTREPRQGRAVSDRMLTPVIFSKDVVAAIGHYQLKKLIRTGTLSRRKSAVGAPR